jgi:hypothetical protein
MYGETYGPSESSINGKIPQCQVEVTYKADCGHAMAKIPCSASFEYASGLKKSPECKSQIKCLCPICRSSVNNECWLAQFLQSFKIWSDESVLYKNTLKEICISEASFKNATIPEFTPRIEKLLPMICGNKINILRICSPNHITSINCYQLLEILMLRKSLKPCHSPIDRILPCKHVVSVDCSKKDQNPPPLCEAKVDDVYTYTCGVHKIKPNKCSELTSLKTRNPKCNQQVTCARYRCGHELSIPCYLKESAETSSPGRRLTPGQNTIQSQIEYSDPEIGIPACNVLVNYQYEKCGHLRMGVKCSEAFFWAANNEKELDCTQKIDFNNPVCRHQNKALCYEIDLIRQWNPWTNEPVKPKLTVFALNYDEDNKPIIAYSMEETNLKLQPAPKNVSKEALVCQVPFSINRKCGHTFLTTCSNAYWQTYSKCEEQVSIECEKIDCKHNRILTCNMNENEKRSGKRSACKNMVSRMCKKCMINKVEVECSQVVIECHSQSSTTLPCGHEASWSCGTEEDPRENPLNCQPCIFAKWESLIKSDIASKENQQLIKQIEIKIDKILADVHVEKNKKIPLPNDFENHNKCRQEIMERYLTNARNKFTNISAPKTKSLADLSFYELVFAEVKEDSQINNDFYFDQSDTEYGRGCELYKLNMTALKNCKPDDDGLIHVLIGAAYRFNILTHSPPYLVPNKKGAKKANKLSTKQRQEGFDGIQSSSNESDVKRYVFWEPGSCIQLKMLSLKMSEMCKICFDYYTGDKGYSCSKKHFLCWDCFKGHVDNASGPDSVGKCVDDEGCLLCPECSESFTLLNVAKESAPQAVFDSLENLKSTIKTKKAVDEALKEQETRLNREFERIQSIKDEEERKAERLRLEIINDILTLRCPRCKTAFLDYSGCAALTCGVCKAGFCALCLLDCGGTDAHQHVANCRDNTMRNVFIPQEFFNKHHSKRRENLIYQKIQNETDKTKTIVCKRMEKDFRDLGIQINFQIKATNSSNNGFLANIKGMFNIN